MKARIAISALIFCCVLAGCNSIPATENPEPAPLTEAIPEPAPSTLPIPRAPASEVDNLLAYFQRIRMLPAADLGREHEAARQAFQSSRAEVDRVRLAMLLALPGTPVSDEPRALELLEPVAKNPSGKLSGLAVLLAANLQERKRLDANAQNLQQKLDALKSLERDMIERKR